MPIDDEMRWWIREGARKSFKWVMLPVIIFVLAALAYAGVAAVVQSNRIPDDPASMLKEDQANLSTDLYADSFLSALACMKTEESGGCNKNDSKSLMIQTVTDEILIMNGKKYAIPTKESLLKTVKTTQLSKIEYLTLQTETRGGTTNPITYANKKTVVTLEFTKNVEGEYMVKSITVKENAK